MAWSHAIRLRDYAAAPAPQAPGVYEIGFVRNHIFNGLYVGKALSIYGRLQAHYTGAGNQGVRDYRLRQKRDHLWCHWMQDCCRVGTAGGGTGLHRTRLSQQPRGR